MSPESTVPAARIITSAPSKTAERVSAAGSKDGVFSSPDVMAGGGEQVSTVLLSNDLKPDEWKFRGMIPTRELLKPILR